MQELVNEEARELRRQYYKEWRKKNPDKVKVYVDNYWIKKSLELRKSNNIKLQGGD